MQHKQRVLKIKHKYTHIRMHTYTHREEWNISSDYGHKWRRRIPNKLHRPDLQQRNKSSQTKEKKTQIPDACRTQNRKDQKKNHHSIK